VFTGRVPQIWLVVVVYIHERSMAQKITCMDKLTLLFSSPVRLEVPGLQLVGDIITLTEAIGLVVAIPELGPGRVDKGVLLCDGVRMVDAVPGILADTLADGVELASCVAWALLWGDCVGDVEAPTEGIDDGTIVGDGDSVGVTDSVAVPDCAAVLLGVIERDAELESDEMAEGVIDAVAVAEEETLAVTLGDSDAVTLGVSDRVALGVGDNVALGVGDGASHCTKPADTGSSLSPTVRL
jgi:hypothetical protein